MPLSPSRLPGCRAAGAGEARPSCRLCCRVAAATEARRSRRPCHGHATGARGSRGLRRRSPPPGRRAAGAREPPAPSERDERAAHCRLSRRGERGIARAVGARRARWSRHLSPPPGCRSEEAARAAGARRARGCAPFAATAAGPLGRGRCLRRRSEESAPVAPPMPSPRRWSKGTTPVAPPFAAAALPGRRAAGAREPPAPGGGKTRCALPPQSPLRRPRRGERGIRPCCRSEKSAQGAPPVPAATILRRPRPRGRDGDRRRVASRGRWPRDRRRSKKRAPPK